MFNLTEILNQIVSRTTSNIYKGTFWRNIYRLKYINYFCIKLDPRCLLGILIRLSLWIFQILIFAVFPYDLLNPPNLPVSDAITPFPAVTTNAKMFSFYPNWCVFKQCLVSSKHYLLFHILLNWFYVWS